MTDHAELQRLAEAAQADGIHGPWFSQPSEHEPPRGVVYGPDGDSFASIEWNPGNDYDPVATAAYLAAASPTTTLALLAEIAALREALTASSFTAHRLAPYGHEDLFINCRAQICIESRAALADGEATR